MRELCDSLPVYFVIPFSQARIGYILLPGS